MVFIKKNTPKSKETTASKKTRCPKCDRVFESSSFEVPECTNKECPFKPDEK